MGVKLCQWCREVRFEAGLSWCGLHQRDFPDATQCGRYQPDAGPGAIQPEPQVVVSAEFGTGIAFADNEQ